MPKAPTKGRGEQLGFGGSLPETTATDAGQGGKRRECAVCMGANELLEACHSAARRRPRRLQQTADSLSQGSPVNAGPTPRCAGSVRTTLTLLASSLALWEGAHRPLPPYTCAHRGHAVTGCHYGARGSARVSNAVALPWYGEPTQARPAEARSG
jgi:hypothetical protein